MRHLVAGSGTRRAIGAVTAALIGAGVGIFLAWLLNVTGHPAWSVLLMIFCAIAPSMMIALYEPGEDRLTFLRWVRWQASPWLKVVAALLLIGVTLFVLDALNVNPRDYAYLPLLPPIIVSAVLLGSGPALVGVIAGTIVADYAYAPPPYSFAVTEWKDAAGLAVFAIVGALNAWMIHQLISLPK